MNDIAIVVVAYNRPHSLRRILSSLATAEYREQDIPLIISIDQGDNADVIAIANEFDWEFGEKRVVCQEQNLGLKAHILKCGGYTREYGNIIMLEDDLFVSPVFFAYARAALAFAEDKDYIGGISLYNHLFNVHVREPFQAFDDGFDNWYMQFASSWGQAWSQKQWDGFTEWYAKNAEKDLRTVGKLVPENVLSWSEQSWLKHYIKYLIDTDKYFLYPKTSLTTNFFDEGTHAAEAVTDLQVPLCIRMEREYSFSTLEDSSSVYDAFFENVVLRNKVIEVIPQAELIEIDLYGYKETKKRYVLSSAAKPYKVLTSYGRKLRPLDANILFNIEGSTFFLYDTSKPAAAPKLNLVQKYLYHYRGMKAKYMILMLRYRVKERLGRKKQR